MNVVVLLLGSCVSCCTHRFVCRSDADVSAWFTVAVGVPCQLVRQQSGAHSCAVSNTLPGPISGSATLDVFLKNASGSSPDSDTSTGPGMLDGQPTIPSHLSACGKCEGRSLGFANEGQLLLINKASLDDLNFRMVSQCEKSSRRRSSSQVQNVHP